jgi:hypothetical protein
LEERGLIKPLESGDRGVWAGALLVLAAWTRFVIDGFAKFSEHFDEGLPHRLVLIACLTSRSRCSIWARLIVLTLMLWTVVAVAARLRASEARKKLGRYLDALEAGMDPALIAEGTRVA